jgi:MFS family permease
MIQGEEVVTQVPGTEIEIERHYRHNFIVNMLDGTSFWLGYSFIAPGVILPIYVSHFTANPLIIGLVAVISSMGYFFPQLFTANWVEQLPLKKIVPVNLGFFLERMPIFLMMPAAFLFFSSPSLALFLFLLLFAWHSFGAGTVAVAWQDMIAKVIPLSRRGRFMGITNFGGTATGVIGAAAAAWLLTRYAFPYGFIACFGLASIFIFMSWVFLALTREPPVLTRQSVITRQEYWNKLPGILRGDKNFRRFILSQGIINLGGMAWGFLAVYATQKWGLSDGTVGGYTAAMLVGQAAANLFFGMVADRKGYKLVIEISVILSVLTLLLTVIAPFPGWFYIIFVLRGASAAGFILAILFVFEFSTPAQRPTYIGLSNTISAVTSGLAPILGGWLAGVLGYYWLFLAALVASILGYCYIHWIVKDPRHSISIETKPVD